MHMKRNGIIAALCLLWTIIAQALIVSVNGHGDIPEEGLEITVTEAEEDILTGEPLVTIEGKLIYNGALHVTITRSVAGIEDEFCCAGACTSGNGQTTETLDFTPSGLTDWFAHYKPADTCTTVVYTFQGDETRTLTVHYNVTQDIDTVVEQETPTRKILKDGIIYIINNENIYHL